MNKLNSLSRAEMKKVMGGNTIPKISDETIGGGGVCDDWKTKPDVCYNCCITEWSWLDCAEIYCAY